MRVFQSSAKLSTCPSSSTFLADRSINICVRKQMFSVDRYERLFTEVVNCSKALHHVPEIQRRRMFDALYLPVYQYLTRERHKFVESNRNNDPRPFFVGISAPQGCGKTTLTALLEEMMNSEGLPAISMSLDDFYLTGSDQENLARKHSDNSLLQLRGNGMSRSSFHFSFSSCSLRISALSLTTHFVCSGDS